MQLKELIKHINQELKNIFDSQEVEANRRVLLQHFLGLNRAEIQLQQEKLIAEQTVNEVQRALGELKLNKPIDYILKESIFLGYSFFIDEGALIPRSETEELVMLIAERESDPKSTILDIGTGSACIPIGLGLEGGYNQIDACEVSLEALKVAKINVEKLWPKVNLFQLDILNEIPAMTYDIIVSNPPYVKAEEIEGLDKNVKEYEPLIALTPFTDPLLFYKRMITIAPQILKAGGRFYWEIHEDLGQEVIQLFDRNQFEKIELHQDMFGRDRFVTAKRKA